MTTIGLVHISASHNSPGTALVVPAFPGAATEMPLAFTIENKGDTIIRVRAVSSPDLPTGWVNVLPDREALITVVTNESVALEFYRKNDPYFVSMAGTDKGPAPLFTQKMAVAQVRLDL